MKQDIDTATGDLFGGKRPPGRPATGAAMTAAQRQAARRARLKQEGRESITLVLDQDVIDALDRFVKHKDETKSQAAERILRDRLLRKR